MSATVLFDTAVASYWYAGNPGWCTQLEAELLSIQKDRDSVVQLVSAVTWQELFVFAAGQQEEPRLKATAWFRRQFATPIAFTGEIAEIAATLQAKVDFVRTGTRGERTAAKDVWFRDAVIVATAIQMNVDYLIYCDRDLDRWRGDFDGKVLKLPAPPAPPAPPT